MNRPATAGATLSFSTTPGQRTALSNKNGVSHFSYNGWQQQQTREEYYITRTGLVNNGSATTPYPNKPGSATLRSGGGGSRVGSGQASTRAPASTQTGQRLLGKTRSEASSVVGKDPAWRHTKLHDARILTELTFLKISEGYDLLDPNFHRSPNTKPIGNPMSTSSRKPFMLPKGAIPINPTVIPSTGKFGGLLVNTDHNNALIMNATRCKIRERKGSADSSSSANGRSASWSRSSANDVLSGSTSPVSIKPDYVSFYKNTLMQDQHTGDLSKFPVFRRGNTLPSLPTYPHDNHPDRPINSPNNNNNNNRNNNNHTTLQSEESVKQNTNGSSPRERDGIIKLENSASSVGIKPASPPDRITKANLSLSDFVCINVAETADRSNDVISDTAALTSPEIVSETHGNAQLPASSQSPLASFSSISTAVEKYGSKKRSVRFSINHQVREYSPWAPIDGPEEEEAAHADR